LRGSLRGRGTAVYSLKGMYQTTSADSNCTSLIYHICSMHQ
jgi:hypothetical protein